MLRNVLKFPIHFICQICHKTNKINRIFYIIYIDLFYSERYAVFSIKIVIKTFVKYKIDLMTDKICFIGTIHMFNIAGSCATKLYCPSLYIDIYIYLSVLKT